MNEHREALEYDLLTETGHSIEDVGDSLSWESLHSFIVKSKATSALARDINPEVADWSTVKQTNIILADIYDLLAVMNANLVGLASRKPAKKPKRYKRPGMNDEDRKVIGKDALPVEELHKWIERKSKEAQKSHGKRS